MAHSKFSLHGPAFEASTRRVMQPGHIMLLQVEEEDLDAVVNPRIFLPPPGAPEPQQERGEQAAPDMENPLLNCIMGDAGGLHTFQEYEWYHFNVNSGSDCDVPYDDSSDDETMEDIPIERDQPIPVNLKEEDNPIEGDQPSPGNSQVEDNLIEGFQPSPVNLQVRQVDLQVTAEAPRTPRQLEVNVATFERVCYEADQEAIPGIHMGLQVQTVLTTSAEEGESSCSSRILMDIQVDRKAESGTYELLSESMKGESSEKNVNEAPSVDLKLELQIAESHIEALHKLATHDQLINCSFSTPSTSTVQEGAATTFKRALEEPRNNASEGPVNDASRC